MQQNLSDKIRPNKTLSAMLHWVYTSKITEKQEQDILGT